VREPRILLDSAADANRDCELALRSYAPGIFTGPNVYWTETLLGGSGVVTVAVPPPLVLPTFPTETPVALVLPFISVTYR
jgi:hypothetical protein